MKKKVILILALMISTTLINAASNSMDSYIQDKTSSNACTSSGTSNWKSASADNKASDMWMDLYTLKKSGKSLLKNPKHFDAFMYIAEHHFMYSLASVDIGEYPTPEQIADMSNKVLGVLNNLDAFTVENKLDVYNYDWNYGTQTKKSNTKNYKDNTTLINAFLEGKVLPRKNLGDAPFKAKMFAH